MKLLTMARGVWKNNHESYLALAVTILKERNKPMNLDDLSKEILRRRRKPHGKTPKKSIYSALWHAKEITTTKNGLYSLKEWG